jgi:transcriptional regulator with XRE-family HTH domain
MRENLSSILSSLMEQKGIKSAELARKIGIAQPVIYRLMSGETLNPQLLTLKPIADFFNISLDQLVGYSSLNNNMDAGLSHILNNKLTTIKTIGSALNDLLPVLIDGYKQAIKNDLTVEHIPFNILDLLEFNCANLLQTIVQIQELLSSSTFAERNYL